MQRVDPFIPVTPRGRPPVPASPQPYISPRQASPRQQPVHRPQTAPTTPPASSAKHQHMRTAAKPKEPRSKKSLLATLWQALFLLGALSLGLVVRSVVVGQIAVLVYAVLVFVYKIESRTTFILGLAALGVVLVSSLRGDSVLATAFAIYAFLLLAIGTISLAREVRDDI